MSLFLVLVSLPILLKSRRHISILTLLCFPDYSPLLNLDKMLIAVLFSNVLFRTSATGAQSLCLPQGFFPVVVCNTSIADRFPWREKMAVHPSLVPTTARPCLDDFMVCCESSSVSRSEPGRRSQVAAKAFGPFESCMWWPLVSSLCSKMGLNLDGGGVAVGS